MRPLLILVVMLAGCANSSGVIATGDNSYTVTGQADLGVNKSAIARQMAFDSATAFCARTLRHPVVTKAIDEDLGHDTIFENRGGMTITFTCVDGIQ